MNQTTYLSKIKKGVSFKSLSNEGKLLMYTIVTDPHLSIVGVLFLDPLSYCGQLSWDKSLLKSAIIEVTKSKMLTPVIVDNKDTYLCLSGFITQAPKSDSRITKVKEILSQYPKGVVDTLNIKLDRNARVFKKPTPEEVSSYALERGYQINGKDFVDYYEDLSKDMGSTDKWFDKTGKEVKDWKGKLRRIWLKPERKLKFPDGAPEGFETFSVKYNGKLVIPDFWLGGIPKSKQAYLNKVLLDEYKKRKAGS